MITAVDSNILIDIFAASSPFVTQSEKALARCLDEGTVVACGIVWIELAPAAPSIQDLQEKMSLLPIGLSTILSESYLLAAKHWRNYKHAGGTRERIVADFLIGAHALVQCDRLLTRDRGFYRRYFKELNIFDPS
jgi:predicted nucleic acid-binding protein